MKSLKVKNKNKIQGTEHVDNPRFQTSKKNAKGVTPLAIWVKTAVFQKIAFVNNVNNVCLLVTLR